MHRDRGQRPAFQEDPATLAKRAIRLLETRIYEDYGLKVAMGAELEFAVHPQYGAGVDTSFGLPDKSQSKNYDYLPSAIRPFEQKDLWFPESGEVNRVYRETSTPCNWQQLEVVFSHKPCDPDGSSIDPSGCALAGAIEEIRAALQTLPDRRSPAPQGMSPFLKMKLGKEISNVNFEPSIPGSTINNGLHINMSVSTDDGAEPFLNEKRRSAYRNAIGEMMEENLYLLGCEQGALTRWQHRYGKPVTTYFNQINEKVTPETYYLENTLPAANSNPYYAIMLELAGVYYVLALRSEREVESEVPTHHMDMLSKSMLRTEFESGERLKNTLNSVEPGLGDRFYNAISLIPPGEESLRSRNGRTAR